MKIMMFKKKQRKEVKMEKQCERCGNIFQSKRDTKKFCSETCKQYAYLIRHGLNIPRLHIVNNVNDNKQEHLNMEENIIFEQPLIIKLIEDYMNNQRDLDSMISNPDSYWSKNDALMIKWVNMRLKCILHNLIRLSYKPKVFPATLSALSGAMMQFVRSNKYRLLPENYPYKFFIKQLTEKIKEVTEQSINYSEIKLPLSQRRKAEFIAILYNLSSVTPLRKFSELTFD